MKCLKYAKGNIEKPEAFWNNVLWNDKTKMLLFGHQQRRYIWRKNGEDFGEKNNLPTMKHGGQSIMLWGCVATGCTGNIVQVEGRMKSTKFQEILKANVQRSAQKLKCRLAVGGLPVRSHPGRVEVSLSKTPNPQLLLTSWLVPCMAANRRWCVNVCVNG